MNRLDFDRQFPGPVLGLDEVGTGALAGPITVCGLVLPGDREVEEILYKAGARDSKKLSASRRESIADMIREHFIWYYVVQIEAKDYKRGRMTQHLDDLFRRVLTEALTRGPRVKTVIIDGSQDRDLRGYNFKAIPKADDKSLTVACASIMAKVHRDKLMSDLEVKHPGYGFAQNKGYCTEQHKKALVERGSIQGIHRDCRMVRMINASQSKPQEEGSAFASTPHQAKIASSSVRRSLYGSGRFH